MSSRREKEKEIREKLEIPASAAKVLVFAESSHWDPDWLLTSEEYYRLRIKKILDRMIYWLKREPKRVYSLESVFFLRLYWERNPENRETIREWVNSGRIRLSGSGINTPDTILPPLEALFRDYLHGQEWLRENGMVQEPRLAYLPDNFGNSPNLPTLLKAMGFEYAAFSRIDGLLFPGSDYRRPGHYPLPGSSAHLLLREKRSADFTWRDANGEEILCHLNPFTYGQGDTLIHGGVARWMGLKVGLPSRSTDLERSLRKIFRFIRQLEPLSPTPYMFCPIGLDFNDPLPRLVEVLEEYNRIAYPETGVFVVNASLEDYLDLVSAHRSRLPVVRLDPNPYFMGFYLSRPEVKQLWDSVVRCLVAAEKLLVEREFKGDGDRNEALWRRLRDLWDRALMANHHDFITGTAPARVWEREQKPLLLRWGREAREILEEILAGEPSEAVPATSDLQKDATTSRPSGRKAIVSERETARLRPIWKIMDDILRVETSRYMLEIDRRRGGCISRLADLERGSEVLSGPGNDVVLYRDGGGLWRMGHEFLGGAFRERECSSDREAAVRVTEGEDFLRIEVIAELDGLRVVRRIWCRQGSPLLEMRLEGRVADHRTATVRFPLARNVSCLLMEVNGGLVRRTSVKLYEPTFWAAGRLVIPEDEDGGWDVAFLPGVPSCVGYGPDRGFELAVMRNASRERVFGILPLLSFPASGPERGVQVIEYALLLPPANEGEESLNACLKVALGESPSAQPLHWKTIPEEVMVAAVKRPLRGKGYIVRLYSPFPGLREVTLFREDMDIEEAFLCDAREREMKELPVSGGRVYLAMSSPLATVRVFPARG
ncbi:glycoside hydrolase family 38 N-terminal domain-containing protein [Candidatus Solincola sp.]